MLINCLPADHVPGMLPWLRNFTDMPLGVYPNQRRYLDPGWRFDERVGPEDYAGLALQWREEGAQIVGGCCGVTPEHIAAVKKGLTGTKPRRGREVSTQPLTVSRTALCELERGYGVPQPWVDDLGRSLFPLRFLQIVCDPGVFRPTQAVF